MIIKLTKDFGINENDYDRYFSSNFTNLEQIQNLIDNLLEIFSNNKIKNKNVRRKNCSKFK